MLPYLIPGGIEFKSSIASHFVESCLVQFLRSNLNLVFHSHSKQNKIMLRLHRSIKFLYRPVYFSGKKKRGFYGNSY